jgi:hypothetical protein
MNLVKKEKLKPDDYEDDYDYVGDYHSMEM